MNMTLQLSREQQLELERRAAESGRNVADYVLDLVKQQLELDENGAATQLAPFDEWNRHFQAWIGGHRSRNPEFDDTRESIYD
jgi:hypothetical protein